MNNIHYTGKYLRKQPEEHSATYALDLGRTKVFYITTFDLSLQKMGQVRLWTPAVSDITSN